MHNLVTQPSGQLGLRLVVGSLITFWSAAAGTKSMLSALNVAYNVDEQRGFFRFQATALGMTLAAMVVAVLGIAVLVFIPVLIDFIGLEADSGVLIHAAGVVMLVVFVAASIAVLYRSGPSRRRKAVQRVVPGNLGRHPAMVGRFGPADRLCRQIAEFRRHLRPARRGGRHHAVVLHHGVCDTAWRRIERPTGMLETDSTRPRQLLITPLGTPIPRELSPGLPRGDWVITGRRRPAFPDCS